MQCAHCGFSCARSGEHMSLAVLHRALALVQEYRGGLAITIGGGEPTVHPSFWHIIDQVKKANPYPIPTVITNGKLTKTALKLASLAKNGYIRAFLSQDDYHEKIQQEVIAAFKPSGDLHDLRQIRTIFMGHIINVGRAKENGLGNVDSCLCNVPLIDPRGVIWRCGCKTESLGTVFLSDKELLFSYLKLAAENKSTCSRVSTNIGQAQFGHTL